jgi:hypothetical protein
MLNFFHHELRRIGAFVVTHGDIVAAPAQLQRNGFADAARSAAD